MIDLTIFTPSYNREELLKRLYGSLQRQTVKKGSNLYYTSLSRRGYFSSLWHACRETQ